MNRLTLRHYSASSGDCHRSPCWSSALQFLPPLGSSRPVPCLEKFQSGRVHLLKISSFCLSMGLAPSAKCVVYYLLGPPSTALIEIRHVSGDLFSQIQARAVLVKDVQVPSDFDPPLSDDSTISSRTANSGLLDDLSSPLVSFLATPCKVPILPNLEPAHSAPVLSYVLLWFNIGLSASAVSWSALTTINVNLRAISYSSVRRVKFIGL